MLHFRGATRYESNSRRYDKERYDKERYGANGPGIRVSAIETENRKLGFAYGRIATV